MKNNRGITLTSLVIYITLIFVIIGIMMRVTTHFIGNMRDAADISFETEFDKLNLYFLDESKNVGNEILEVGDTQISFLSGNKYTYNTVDNIIYLNNSIKICENVEYCLFEHRTAENGRDVIVIEITIKDTTKKAEYFMINKGTNQVVNELDYTWGESIINVATE